MFDQLPAAFIAHRPVRLHYQTIGPRAGEIIRVANQRNYSRHTMSNLLEKTGKIVLQSPGPVNKVNGPPKTDQLDVQAVFIRNAINDGTSYS